ncbi:MAG: CPBP family intramembrane glutamic endopeptidase [Thermoleophilaceae bacterium]
MASGSTYEQHPAPPAGPPELPEGVTSFPRWPAWYGPVGLVCALVIATIAYLIVKSVAVATGANPDHDSHTVTLIAVILQDLILVATAVGLAALTRKPELWQFGIRRSRFWPTAGWAALGLLTFYVAAAAYAAVVHPHGQQKVAEDLGAKNGSGVAIAAAAFAVIVVAPACEEIFFRGFFYRALRTRLGVAAAAVIDGLVFGAIHAQGSPASVLPILALLGVIFCLVYERTGTIFSTIALHSINNTISYAATVHGGGGAAAVCGAGMLAACVLVPRALPARAPALS